MEPITDEVIDFVGIGFVIMMPTLRVFAAGACSQNGIVLNSLKYVLYKMMADVGCIKADSADFFLRCHCQPISKLTHHHTAKLTSNFRLR